MTKPYPYQQLSIAVQNMATNPNSIQERIAVAYTYRLAHVKEEDVPAIVRHDLIMIKEKLAPIVKIEGGDSLNVSGPILEMNDEDVVEIANRILKIYDAVLNEYFGR
jgi:hypothetical protein